MGDYKYFCSELNWQREGDPPWVVQAHFTETSVRLRFPLILFVAEIRTMAHLLKGCDCDIFLARDYYESSLGPDRIIVFFNLDDCESLLLLLDPPLTHSEKRFESLKIHHMEQKKKGLKANNKITRRAV